MVINENAIYWKDIEFLKAFGKRLKQLREEKGISQAQLAFEAEIQISQVSRIERGLIKVFGLENQVYKIY